MWSRKLPDVLDISCDGRNIVFGCRNGWVFVFNSKELLWSKKLISTYYRGPFEDVNVTSVDVGYGFVAVGTDFADGKVYLFDLSGKRIFERQLLSILGCWERPDDVKFVKLTKNFLGVISGFMDDKLTVLNYAGEIIDVKAVNDFVRCFDVGDVIALGCDSRSYVYRNDKVDKFDFGANDVVVVGDCAVFANDRYVISSFGWKIKADKPKLCADELIAYSSAENVFLCDIEGRVIDSWKIDGKILDLIIIDGNLIVLTSRGLFLNGEFAEIRGFKLCPCGVIFKSGDYYSFKSWSELDFSQILGR